MGNILKYKGKEIQTLEQSQQQIQVSVNENKPPEIFEIDITSLPNTNIVNQEQNLPDLDDLHIQQNNNSNQSETIEPFADDESIVPKLENTNLQQQYNLEQNLLFEIRAKYNHENLLKEQAQYLPGIISLKAQENFEQQFVGVDLICLIDRSASMKGKKLLMVQKSLKILLNYLKQNDRLQLITFDGFAQRLTTLKKVNDENKQYFQNIINEIIVGSGTNIARSTKIAFQQLQQRKYKNNVTSIFLLSDGQDILAEKKVKIQLQNINQSFTIHSFGFGFDHDAKMMTALCKLGNGSFYFVQDITLLDEYFVDALGGLISVVGQQLQIDVNCQPKEPFSQINIHKTYGNMWKEIKQQRQYKIEIPQITSGLRKDFVFELELPKFTTHIEDNQRNTIVITANLSLINPFTQQKVIKQAQLELTIQNPEELIYQNDEDIDVTSQYYRVKAADIIEDARIACEQNKNEEAEKMIDQIIAQINQNSRLLENSKTILSDLQQAKQASSRASYDSFGKSQMLQMSCNIYQQQGINSKFSAQGVQQKQIFQKKMDGSNSISLQMMMEVQQQKISK